MTLTGVHLAGTPRSVNDVQAATDRLIARIFPPKPKPTPAFHHETGACVVDDETVLRRARLTHTFRDLEAGGGEDASAADQSYCDALVAAGADAPGQVLRIWHAGRRWRPKLRDRRHYASGETYAEHTAAEALRRLRPEPLGPPRPDPHRGGAAARRRISGVSRGCPLARPGPRRRGRRRGTRPALERRTPDREQHDHHRLDQPAPEGRSADADPDRDRGPRRERRGDADERGFVPISTAKIGDDYGDKQNPRVDGLDAPIRSRSTVGRHHKKVADLGLIEREVRTATVDRIVRDKDGKPKIDPATNKPKTYRADIEQTWVNLTGETITELLRPFAFFRMPPSMPGELPQAATHGGDRPTRRRGRPAPPAARPAPTAATRTRDAYVRRLRRGHHRDGRGRRGQVGRRE